MSCAGCVVKDAKILAQQLEITLLKAEVNRLQQIIFQARQTAAAVEIEGRTAMGEHCPRGVWSYHKGSRTAASRIERQLR